MYAREPTDARQGSPTKAKIKNPHEYVRSFRSSAVKSTDRSRPAAVDVQTSTSSTSTRTLAGVARLDLADLGRANPVTNLTVSILRMLTLLSHLGSSFTRPERGQHASSSIPTIRCVLTPYTSGGRFPQLQHLRCQSSSCKRRYQIKRLPKPNNGDPSDQANSSRQPQGFRKNLQLLFRLR